MKPARICLASRHATPCRTALITGRGEPGSGTECGYGHVNKTRPAAAELNRRATLLAGKPILVLPLYVEQLLTALRVGELGAANLIGLTRDERPDDASLLEPLLAEPRLADRARALALRHAGHDPAAAAMAARCESLLPGQAAARARRG